MKIGKSKLAPGTTCETIKKMYPDPQRYRVSEKRSRSGVRCPVSSQEGVCHIISGQCTFEFKNYVIEAEAFNRFVLPSGKYWFCANLEVGVKYVMVWDIYKIAGKLHLINNTVIALNFNTAL